jgi:hypothetical protein
MHKSLLISEIISGVCSELYSAYGSYPGTLAAFAVTCQAISEPALDVLWHTHESIIPLLRCMSDDLWNDSVEFNRNNHLVCRCILISLDFCLRGSYHIHYIVSRKTDTTHTGQDYNSTQNVSESLDLLAAMLKTRHPAHLD